MQMNRTAGYGWRVGLAALVVGLASAGAVEAAQCTFRTTAVSFGTYDVFASAPNDTVGRITYECNGGAKHVVVTITAGLSGSFAPRALVGAGDDLAYNLFRNASRTSVWGDGSGGSQPVYVGDPPNKTEQTLMIYGRIPAGQDVGAGSYGDHVTVTVQY